MRKLRAQGRVEGTKREGKEDEGMPRVVVTRTVKKFLEEGTTAKGRQMREGTEGHPGSTRLKPDVSSL